MVERTERIRGEVWLGDSLERLTGEVDRRKAAVLLAGRELDRVLQFRNKHQGSLVNGIPVLDILLLHPEIDPSLGITMEHQGLTDYQDGLHKISLNPDLLNLVGSPVRNFVIAHEIGHALVRESAKQEGYRVESLYNSQGEEYFCETFASHLLIPDRIVRPKLERLFNLEVIANIITQLQVTPDIFLKWLEGNFGFLDRVKKGVIFSEWWRPEHSGYSFTLGFDRFALPSWGSISLLDREPLLNSYDRIYRPSFNHFEIGRVEGRRGDILDGGHSRFYSLVDSQGFRSTAVHSVKRNISMSFDGSTNKEGDKIRFFIEDADVEHKAYYSRSLKSGYKDQVYLITLFDFPPP